MRRNARPKRRLGQNFLYDPAIARRIVAEADIGPNSVVVELGAGRGILTRAIAETGARLVALEVDRDLYDTLAEELNEVFGADAATVQRVELVNVDFTKVSLGELLSQRDLERCTLMGNIPYNLTREVLFTFLVDAHDIIDGAAIMVQKEVGDRIVSPPGSRVYGITSVVLQSLYDVRTVIKVSPGSFNPRPRVASVVLGFTPLERPIVAPDELGHYKQFVKNVFQQRRKTLQNTMKSFYDLSEAELDAIRSETDIDLQSRPEQLSKEELLSLARALARNSGS